MTFSFNEILDILKNASENFNAGNIDSAIDLYEKGFEKIKPLIENITVNQMNYVATAMFYLGDCYFAKGNEQKAFELYQESINLNVDIGFPYLKVADQHRLNNQWKEAITLYDKALKIGNMNQESVNNTYYNLGVCYEEIDDLENAIESLKQAIAINPDDKDALFNLGMFSARMKHFSDAVNAFKEYLRIDSSSQYADQVRNALQQAASQLNNIGIRQKIDNAIKQGEVAIKQKDKKEFDLAAIMLKECLNENISHEDRMTIHFNLGCMLSMDLEDPKLLSKNQIDEAATNYDFAAHIYDYFIKPDDPSDQLGQIRKNAKARLNHFVFKLGGSVKYWNGPWAKDTTLCSNFTIFEGYPEKYYGNLEKYEADLKQEEQNYRLKNKLCLSCGEKLGFGDKMSGSKYCKKHRT